MDNHELLTPEEAASLLKVSPATLKQWRHEKKGPHAVRLGYRTIRYPRYRIELWLKALSGLVPAVTPSLRIERGAE